MVNLHLDYIFTHSIELGWLTFSLYGFCVLQKRKERRGRDPTIPDLPEPSCLRARLHRTPVYLPLLFCNTQSSLGVVFRFHRYSQLRTLMFPLETAVNLMSFEPTGSNVFRKRFAGWRIRALDGLTI